MIPRRLIALVAGAALLLAACGDDGGTTAADDSTTTTTAAATSTTTTAPDDDGGDDVVVFGALVYFTADEAVATAGRSVEVPAVARGALEWMLHGPQGVEVEIGQTSEIPEGTELLGIDVDDGVAMDGVATVDLSSEFAAGGGSLSMQLRVAQVVFTLTQFATVDTVDITIEGESVDTIGGEGVPARGLDRTDFAAVTPRVLIEVPVPGQAVYSPLEVSGMANTFEANVQYSVTDGEGLIVDEGFTTATAGNGTFGTFTVTSEFEVTRPGVGAVIGFETSAEDGSQVNVYEVPVEIG